jgi:hypothetical protein
LDGWLLLTSGNAHRYVCVARCNNSSSRKVAVVSPVGRFSLNGEVASLRSFAVERMLVIRRGLP